MTAPMIATGSRRSRRKALLVSETPTLALRHLAGEGGQVVDALALEVAEGGQLTLTLGSSRP